MMWLIVLLNMMLASTFTFSKAALYYVSPIFFIGVRMIIGGSLLLLYLACFRKRDFWVSRKDWALLGQITLFHIYGAYVLEFVGMQYVSSAKTCLLFSLTPFISVILSYVFLKEKMTSKKWLGLIIGFIGFIPIVLTTSASEEVLGSLGSISVPEFLILLSACFCAQGWIVMRKLLRERGYTALMVNGFGMITGGALAFLTSLVVESQPFIRPIDQGIDLPLDSWFAAQFSSPVAIVIAYMLILVVIANIVGYNLYAHLLRFYSATFLAFAGFMSPLFAAVYGWFLLNEPVSGSFFASLSIIAVGLYIFYQEEEKRAYENA